MYQQSTFFSGPHPLLLQSDEHNSNCGDASVDDGDLIDDNTVVNSGDDDRAAVGLAPRWADGYLPVSSESPASGTLSAPTRTYKAPSRALGPTPLGHIRLLPRRL